MRAVLGAAAFFRRGTTRNRWRQWRAHGLTGCNKQTVLRRCPGVAQTVPLHQGDNPPGNARAAIHPMHNMRHGLRKLVFQQGKMGAGQHHRVE